MARTSWRMGPKSIPARPAVRMALAAARRLRLPPKARQNPGARRRARPEDPRDEPVTAVYFAAGRHHPLDGWRPSRGVGGLPPIAHLGAASGRLPDHSGTNVLSRRYPRSNAFFANS